jgi:UDP-4-amino-4,6-dideoxy-N-acetyl-beta-L-altrosamine N-acetyltransferase
VNTEIEQALGQLRPIKEQELELMLSWRNAPTVRANMYTQHEISLAEHKGWWAKTSQRVDQEYLMYEHRGVSMGIVAFSGIDALHRNSSWAFYASPDAPRGTGTNMEWLALDHAFGDLGLHKLYCEVLAFNQPVIKLHRKFGFVIEGIRRQHYRSDAGFVDICQLGLLADEWRMHSMDFLEKIIQFSNRKSNQDES